MEGLILAAGCSSRFNSMDNAFKKYFLKVNNSNILSYIITGMIKTGISKITIIASKISNKSKYKQILLNSIEKLGIDFKNFKLNIIENKNPKRENGYSLLLGLNAISSEYTLLSMADHIFSENIFSQLLMNYHKSDILLATDPIHLKDPYKLEDATKIYGLNSFITKIGKEIPKYNRLDMGAFILRTKVIRNLCQEINLNTYKFGVTNVVLLAIESGLNVSYSDFPNVFWLDVDNSSIYHQLKEFFRESSNLHPFGLNIKNVPFIRKKEKT
jgi:CDP-L-myo-inositol myo-inositolphosphotransferase